MIMTLIFLKWLFYEGDVDALFTLQSCSKPFTYAICLKELGSEVLMSDEEDDDADHDDDDDDDNHHDHDHQVVHKYIGQEPSGRNFNEICLDKSGK